jgi:hypothetical protein
MLIWKQTGGWSLLSAAGQPAAVGNVLTVQTTGASTTLAWQALPAQQATAYSVNGSAVASTFGLNLIAGNNTTIAGVLNGSRTDITITAAGAGSGLADPTTTKGDLIARGAAQVTRLAVGTDGWVLMADSTQPLGMKWSAVASGGGSQTPWASNIDAAGYTLSNIPAISAPASNNTLTLNAPGSGGSIVLQANGTTMATVTNASGVISFGALTANVNVSNSNPPQVVIKGQGTAQWNITGTASPTTPGTNALTVQCVGQTAGVYVMNDLGRFGVGVATPAYAVDVAGDVNTTGVYRVAGVPIVTGVSSVFTRTGAVVAAAGDYTAAQVTNAVSTLGSYADPAWITALSWGKITGAPATGVSSVFTRTGAVVAAANDYTAAQVTNAVSTIATYPDPAWITSLSYSKLTGVPANVGLWQSGSGGVIYYNGGSVGIGTASPGYNLDVQSSSDANMRAYTSAGNVASLLLQNAAAGGRNWAIQATQNSIAPAGGLLFTDATAGATRMCITSAGNVGIGTTGPNAPLSFGYSANQLNLVSYPNSDQANFAFYACQNFPLTNSYGRVLDIMAGGLNTGGNIRFLTQPGNGAAVAAMLINGNGLVGIGTTSLMGTLTSAANTFNPTGNLAGAFVAQGNYGGGLIITGSGIAAGIWITSSPTTLQFRADGSGTSFPGNTGQMALNSSGNLSLQGSCNITGQYLINGTPIVTNGMTAIHCYQDSTLNSTRPNLNFTTDGTNQAYVTDNAGLGPGGSANVTFAPTSDARLKRNVTDLTGGVAIIEQLRPVAFEWNGACGHREGQRSASILAQELQAILPDSIFTMPGQRLHPEGAETIDLLCFDPIQLTAHLILAVQQLSKRLAALEAKKPD